MADKNIKATATLQLKTEGKTDLNELRSSLEAFGDEGIQAAQRIVDGFENVDKKSGSIANAFNKGRVASDKAVAEMVIGLQNLESEITTTFGSLEKAPEQVRDAFQKLAGQVDQNRQRFIATRNSISDVNAEMLLARGRINDMGDVLNLGLSPGVQQATLRFGQFSAALGAGISAGMAFNKFIGADTSTAIEGAKAKAEELKDALRGVIYALSDSAVAAAAGKWDEVTKKLTEADAAMILSKEAMHGFRIAADAGVEGLEDLIGREEELAAVSAFATQAMAAGKEGQELYNMALGKGVGTLDEMVARVENFKGRLTELQTIQAEEKEWAEKIAAARERQAEKVKALTEQYGIYIAQGEDLTDRDAREIEQVMSLEQAEGGLTDALRAQIATVSDSMQQGDARSQLLAKQVAELQDLLNNTDNLTAAQRAEIQAVIDSAKAWKDKSDAEREAAAQRAQDILLSGQQAEAAAKTTIVWKDGQAVLTNTTAESEKLADATIKITKASGEAIDPVKKLGGEFKDAKPATEELGAAATATAEEIDSLAGRVENLRERIAELNKEALASKGIMIQLSESLRDTGAAAEEAAGAEE